MLTKVMGHDARTINVCSPGDDVRVLVESDIDELPNATLSRRETHEVLVKAKAQAEEFIAAVEGDIQATEG